MGKATARARHGSYIFQRPGSSNWYVRLRSPDKTIVQSLGTADKLKAEILALPMAEKHKAKLLAARPRIETTWQSRLEPGLHVGPDGGHIAATERELTYYNHNGGFLRSEPNGGPAQQIVGGPLTVSALAGAVIEADFGAGRGERPKVPAKNGDDAILETYIKHAKLAARFAREAREMWALYKTLTDSKPLKNADRADGRKLVAHFESQELKRATIQKKIGWLTSAVNLAIKEGRDGDKDRLTFNPFSSIIPKADDGEDDAQDRRPLDDADIAATKARLGELDKSDQRLFRLLACTGMRLSEAFEIGRPVKVKIKTKVNGKIKVEWKEQVNRELIEDGIRFCIVGHKSKASKRRVPFPADVLPHIPKSITAPLFVGTPAAASKRLNRFIRDCGIDDPSKVLHSLRHRAQDRLRTAKCYDPEMRWAILGHEKETVAAGYGEGFAVSDIKEWIDKIGF
jgi:integrase